MEDTDNINDIAESQDGHVDQPASSTPVETRPRRRPWRPFEIAVTAALASILIGSALVVAWMYLVSEQGDASSLLIIWTIIVVYSGMFVAPVSIFVAWPLMIYFRNASNWWLLACIAASVVFAGVAAVVFTPDVFLQMLAYTTTYALIFGAVAIWLRRWR